MAFLTGWRIALAADLLLEPDATVGSVARQGRLRQPVRALDRLQTPAGHEPEAVPRRHARMRWSAGTAAHRGARSVRRARSAPTPRRAASAPPPATRSTPLREPALARIVTPTPDEALLNPNFPCRKQKITDAMTECAFGAPAETATATVALIGDSHAQHWRSGLAVVAKRRGWRVLDVSGPLCMFSTATTGAGPPFDKACGQWNTDVLAWLAAHPEIHTIFTAGKRRQFVRPAPGQSGFEARRDGYAGRWATLPASVTSVVVIRDAPAEDVKTKDCVRRRMAHRRVLTRACGVPRRHAVRPDPAVAAARRFGAHVIDLTPQFCDARRCYPVIGGALVHKDADHLTQVFARTLGPSWTAPTAT